MVLMDGAEGKYSRTEARTREPKKQMRKVSNSLVYSIIRMDRMEKMDPWRCHDELRK
jgi:hypothetical protein